MAITKKEVEHIANLARIKLSEKEVEKLTEDLGDILNYINKLKEIKTDNIEPTAQITGLENIFRQDLPVKTDSQIKTAAEMTQAAPRNENGYVKVKQVFEENE